MLRNVMNNIMQNVKIGLANIKELFGIMLSDDNSNDGYDFYINSSDTGISETAKLLKDIEHEQEEKRFSTFFSNKTKKDTKKKPKIVNNKYDTSQNVISSNVPFIDKEDLEK